MRKSLYVMGILDDADIEWMAANGRRRTAPKGEVLVREGEPIDALFVLLDGWLEVSAGGIFVARLLSGEIVGEISFVDSRPPLATVTAMSASSVLAIPRAKLIAKIDSDPWFASRFFRALALFLADRLRTTTGRLGYGSAAQDRDDPREAEDQDEIGVDLMDSVSLAATRFDRLLKRLQHGAAAG